MKQFAIPTSNHHANIACFNGDHYKRMQTNVVSEDGMGQFNAFSGLNVLASVYCIVPSPFSISSNSI